LILHVRLTPRARDDRVEGWGEDDGGRPVLLVKVRAQPIEGEANAALERVVAKALGLSARSVRVACGGRSRLKALEIDGLDEEEVRTRLCRPAPQPL
jgi:uncharacterized protein YggU (UPF0235/DUF167 family)